MERKCKFGILFIIVNTIILGVFSSISHFAYDLSGGLTLIGLFNPVNESVWEHLKFMFFPNVIWFIVTYFILKGKCYIDPKKWIIAAAVSAFMAPLLVILLFYGYTGAFGCESVIVDIALAFICYFLALSIALHVYTFVAPSQLKIAISIIYIVLMTLTFFIFTFNPPHIPLFLDTTTGTYGIALQNGLLT